MTDSLLNEYWLTTLLAYNKLIVGFSGGLDSTVLLHLMAQQPALIGKLHAVHIHHGLSEYADAWLLHCKQACKSLSVPLTVRKVQCDSHSNIEEGARIARYRAFSAFINDNDALVLAHHADDQAETLLLQLFRGAGIDGMAAMTSMKALTKGELLRPFLEHSRRALEAYAHDHQLTWVEDESNQSHAFSRNFLRHRVMPLLQEKWPGVAGNLARSAKHCQQAKLNLDSLANLDIKDLNQQGTRLSLLSLRSLSRERMVNVLRVWLRNNNIRRPGTLILNRLIDEVILARIDAMPMISIDHVLVQRFQQDLHLIKQTVKPQLGRIEWCDFPHPLPFNADEALYATPTSNGLLVPRGCRVEIRFRQGGELFYWHGQTKQLKKLWQQWRIPPWRRALIPLLYIDDELAAVVGFAISDYYHSLALENTYNVRVVKINNMLTRISSLDKTNSRRMTSIVLET